MLEAEYVSQPLRNRELMNSEMYDIFTGSAPAAGYTLSDFHLKRMVLSPAHWRGFSATTTLKWKRVKFDRGYLKDVPVDKKGVYSFVIRPGIANHPECAYLMYVGMVERQSFRDRFNQYLNEQAAGDNSRRVHVTELLRKWKDFLWFCYAPIEAKERIKPTEDDLLVAYLPPSNRRFPATIKGQVAKLFSQ